MLRTATNTDKNRAEQLGLPEIGNGKHLWLSRQSPQDRSSDSLIRFRNRLRSLRAGQGGRNE